MAFTVTTVVKTVVGDKRLWSGRVTADAATGVVTVPGATAIDALLSAGLASAATENTGTGFSMVKINANASGTAANGVIGFSGCTTTKVLNITVLYH